MNSVEINSPTQTEPLTQPEQLPEPDQLINWLWQTVKFNLFEQDWHN